MGKIKHGDCKGGKTPEYNTWICMKARCRNPNNPRFKDYGGRGIIVCERWQQFDFFLEDMGRKPSPKLMLERGDNDGNYEPNNCSWETNKIQSNNKSNNIFLEHNNVSHTIKEWAEILNINYHHFWSSIRIRKLTIEKIIANPFPREQFITYRGETLNTGQWAKKLGMSKKNFYRGKYRDLPKDKVVEIFYNKNSFQIG